MVALLPAHWQVELVVQTLELVEVRSSLNINNKQNVRIKVSPTTLANNYLMQIAADVTQILATWKCYMTMATWFYLHEFRLFCSRPPASKAFYLQISRCIFVFYLDRLFWCGLRTPTHFAQKCILQNTYITGVVCCWQFTKSKSSSWVCVTEVGHTSSLFSNSKGKSILLVHCVSDDKRAIVW